MKTYHYALLCCLLLFSSCDFNARKREKANSELATIANKLDLLNTQIGLIQSEVDKLTTSYNEKEQEMQKDSADLAYYLSDHKAAVTAIVAGTAGVAVSADLKDQFTEEQKNFGGWVAVIAGGYALFHLSEIKEVINAQENYNSQKKQLQQQLEKILNDVNVKQETLFGLKQNLAQLEIDSTKKSQEINSYN